MIKIFLLITFALFAQFKHAHSPYPIVSIGIPTCCGGGRGTANNCDPGKPGTGFGAGGGSSGWAGGQGGDAYWLGGGGGGGVGGYGACAITGGAGGMGVAVIQYYQQGSIVGTNVHTYDTTFSVRPEIDTIKVWAVGGGGGGASANTSDTTSAAGGGAGAVAYRTVTGAGGKSISIDVGEGGIPVQGTSGGNGQNGFPTSVGIDGVFLLANGGLGGYFNNSGAGGGGGTCPNGTGASATQDGCVVGGSAYRHSGDVNGSGGGSIGNVSSGNDGNNDDGNVAGNPADVSGLFAALALVRNVAQSANDGLNDIPTTPTAAFSFRRLIFSYTGPCVRVRRSSDNLEKDIGFNGNYCDMADLKTFVGSANGYVTIWYNQNSALPNATQTTAAAQPRIVAAGVPDLGPNPYILTMYLDGNTWLNSNQNIQTITNAGNEGTVFMVARPFGNGRDTWTFGVANDASSNRWMAHFPYQGGQAYNAGIAYFDVGNLNTQRCTTTTFTPHDTWKVWSFIKTSTCSYVFWRLTQGCVSAACPTGQRYTGTENFLIGTTGGPTTPGHKYQGFLSEFIVYNSGITGTDLSEYQQFTMDFFGLR